MKLIRIIKVKKCDVKKQSWKKDSDFESYLSDMSAGTKGEDRYYYDQLLSYFTNTPETKKAVKLYGKPKENDLKNEYKSFRGL